LDAIGVGSEPVGLEGGGAGLTPEQRRPVALRGVSVALGAGAGCGKTTVLTERFLGALQPPAGAETEPGEGGRALRSTLALTFTEKAARELRQRIRGACRDRLKTRPAGEAGYWRSVLRGLGAAPVGTFHGYCADLLRRHAWRAGIDPDFMVLDEAIAASIRDESLARSIRGWLAAEDDDLIELAAETSLSAVRKSLGKLVTRDPEALAAWAGLDEDAVLAAWQGVWAGRGRDALARPLLWGADRCARLLIEQDFGSPKLSAFRSGMLAALSDRPRAIEPDWARALRKEAMLPRLGKNDAWPSPEIKIAVSVALEDLRKLADRYCVKAEADPAASRRSATQGLRFARLALGASRAYDEAKRLRGGLDFDDLIRKARDLLRDHAPAVREAAGRPVGFVLVDEFQDTDPVQGEVLRRLAGDDLAAGRLFLVGDFKQSIYRFRGAEPKVFGAFRAEFPEAGRLDLSVNFRSNSGVIDFVNALFADAFPGGPSVLTAGPGSVPATPGPAVQFVWADESSPAADGTGPKPIVAEARRVEARWLARLLRSKLDAGWTVRDRGTGRPRAAGPGDVAFLFRALTDLAAYERALVDEGFDYHVVGGSTFYAQQEIQDVVNVLSVIEDPLDALALAGALRGPFFGLSDDGLFRLGGGDGAGGAEGLVSAFAGLGGVDGLGAEDRRRAGRAYRLLTAWRGLKDRLPIAGLVDRVLDESGFEAALLGENLGDRKRANARKMVRMARRFDARGGFTLADFVARLRADLRDPPREEQASTTEEEGTSVRLLSVHQSKGLEFPIVVVPDLNRRAGGDLVRVAFHPELGPLVPPGDGEPGAADGENPGHDESADEGEGSGASLGWTTYRALEAVEEEEEGFRLFYVATTRARDALILSAGAKPSAKPASPALRLLDARFDRRTGRLRPSVTLPERADPPEVTVVATQPPRVEPRTPRPPARRPKLRAVAAAIDAVPLRPDMPVGKRAVLTPPTFLDLETQAVANRSHRAGRLAALVRAVLADRHLFSTPAASDRGGLSILVTRAAGRLGMAADSSLLAETQALFKHLLAGQLAAELGRCGPIARGEGWLRTCRTDPARPPATVVRGWTDLAAEFPEPSPHAGRNFVIVTPPGADPDVELFRLDMAYRVATDDAGGRPVLAWQVRLGEDSGKIVGVEVSDEAVAYQFSWLVGL